MSVVAEGASTKALKADLAISQMADEPMISDRLAGALEIAVEDFGAGLWRFRWEAKERIRESTVRG